MKEQLTAVEFLIKELELDVFASDKEMAIIEQAKEMEKEQKIEFACQVAEVIAENYIHRKTTWQIAEELLTA